MCYGYVTLLSTGLLLPNPFQAVYVGVISTCSQSVLSTMLILREFWSASNLHFSLGILLEGYLLIC